MSREKHAKFGVLVGIDGSGKTTLLKQLSGNNVPTENWTNLRSYPDPLVLAPESPTEIRQRLSPLTRAMFIGGLLIAEYEYLVRPKLKQNNSVLLDSYYFKLLAKESIYQKVDPVFYNLCDELPRPDIVFFLEMDPREAYKRKIMHAPLSPYEYTNAGTDEDFVNFQTRLIELIESFLKNIQTVRINGMNPPDIVVKDALLELEKYGFRG